MSKFIFAVDSDGCAMDTMTYKHELFFGPIAADLYEVDDKETFQKNWENINLYTKTRGVNRFTGLVLGLDSVNYDKINIDNLRDWVNTTDSLSPDSLQAEIDEKGTDDLKLALEWSNKVNESIREAEGHDKPFEGALEGLAKLAEHGDVDVVSSANYAAVNEEWTRHGLIEHVGGLYTQEKGKKADVLAGFIEEGTPAENIMMVGDSPGDLEAAEKNNAKFFPILVGKEKESWEKLTTEALDKFINGEFDQAYQDEVNKAFWDNLDN